MTAESRIPVTRAVWEDLSSLKRPGETFDQLLAEMIEKEKKNRLDDLPAKSNRIVKDKFRILEDDPFPGKGGDKEQLSHSRHKDLYRIHWRRT